jgi:hypothetical protein
MNCILKVLVTVFYDISQVTLALHVLYEYTIQCVMFEAIKI